jgi:hypothetical protein
MTLRVVLAPKLVHRKLCTAVEEQKTVCWLRMHIHSKKFNAQPSACKCIEKPCIQTCEKHFSVFSGASHCRVYAESYEFFD